jgi:hypothetical protein
MKYLFIGTGILAAVAFAALTWGPLGKARTPAQPSSGSAQQPASSVPDPPPPLREPPPVTEPVTYAKQPPPPVETPSTPSAEAPQAPTDATGAMPMHRRPRRPAGERAAPVNTAVANGFTAELNRQEVESLRSGRSTARAPWRELSPPR